nr:hypothetical protein [Pseudomonas sp.]
MTNCPERSVRDKLNQAFLIARDAFTDPSEEAVMAVFHRLCYEADLTIPRSVQAVDETVH